MIYCNKTPVKVGEIRGQDWVTRTDDKEYHPDCVGSRFKKYSDLIFWGAYTASEIGPCYLFDKESKEEKDAAETHLNLKNVNYRMQQRFI